MNSVNIGSCYMWPLLHSIMIRGSALVSLLSLNSCGLQKVDVSSRVDSSITSPASKENPQTPYIDPAASDLWPAAKDILDRKCIPCHSAKGPATFAVFDFKTEEEFKLSRFIVPGKSIDSLLIKKSIGFDQSSNMPIGAAWSATEYDALKSWVDGMSTGSRPIGPATSYLVFPGYECRDPGLASAVESRTLKRKTKQELSYKLKDLLSYRLSDQSIANQISDLLDPSFSRMPAERHEKMDVFDQSTNLDFLENYFQAVFIFATEVTKTPALIQDFTDSTCITSGAPTQACIDGVITDLSYSIMERVPLAADIAGLKAAYNADASGRVRGLIATMLMSVPSTHHLYYRGTAVSPNQYLLTDLELAYKMSYLLWGSIPDPTLLTLAKQNQLTQGSNFETQLARMTNHAYFDRGLNNFFTNWYKLDHLQALNKIAPRTLTKLALFGVTDAEKLLQDIKVDGLLFSNWVVKQDLSYDELLLNRRSFAPTGDLAAKIYNVAAWDKANPTEINHSASRAGILTRAFFNWSGQAAKKPILLGAKIQKDFLCASIKIPADTAEPVGTMVTPDMTSRESAEEVTQKAGTACAGCHVGSSQINGKGFALGNFGSWGEDLASQQSPHAGDIVYVSDSAPLRAGQILTTKDINSKSTPKISPMDTRSVVNGRELSEYIVDTKFGQKCLVQKYFEYREREEITNNEGLSCVLKQGYDALATVPNGSIKKMIKALILSPEFRLTKK